MPVYGRAVSQADGALATHGFISTTCHNNNTLGAWHNMVCAGITDNLWDLQIALTDQLQNPMPFTDDKQESSSMK